MGTLYIDRRDAELSVEGGVLNIREPSTRPRSFPLSSIERVVISGNVRVDSRVFTHLVDRGASVLLVDGRGARRHAHVGAFGHGDARRRLGQYRLCSHPAESLRWARLLVRKRASSLLKLYAEALSKRPDCRRELSVVTTQIESRLPSLGTVATVASLRGLEGSIAAAHFQGYASLFSAGLAFAGRNRRPPRDPVNAALSLGYTLTHADSIRACLLAGLDPMLGALHEPAHGRESLACDFNELARADVEKLVWRLFAEKQLRPENFERHAGGVSMNKSARQVFYAAFEQQAQRHRGRLRVATAAFARHCVAFSEQRGAA